MIVYGLTEMDYLASRDSVMAKLIAHYGHFKRGVEQTVFSSLVTHIVSQMLSNKGLSIVLCKFFSQPCRTYASRPTCAHPFRVGYAHSTIRESSGCSISRRVPARADRAA